MSQTTLWAQAVGGAKYVLQITDDTPDKQTLVLNVAGNLIKHYGQDNVEIEIVAFGSGLRFLFDGNGNEERIKNLSIHGVKFSACNNTIEAMTQILGRPPKINPIATVVPGGAVRIYDLIKQGFTLIRP